MMLKLRRMSLYKNKPFIFITRLYYAENSVNEIIKLNRSSVICTTMKKGKHLTDHPAKYNEELYAKLGARQST